MVNSNFVNLSVVIPTINRPKSLQDTINSVLMQNSKPIEIVVIDQSDDSFFDENSSNLLRASKHTGVKIFHHRFLKKSLTAARNFGISNTSSDNILFLDDDVIFHNNVLHHIFKLLSRDDIGIVGAFNYADKEYRPSFLSRFCFGLNTNVFNNGVVSKSVMGFFPSSSLNNPETEWVMGFCFAFKKNLAKQYKIQFDESLSSYGYAEDLDFSFRFIRMLKANKFHAVFCSDAKVEHLVSNEYRIPSKKTMMMFLINRIYLFEKFQFPNRWLIYYKFANRAFERRLSSEKELKKWFKKTEKAVIAFHRKHSPIDIEKAYSALIEEN